MFLDVFATGPFQANCILIGDAGAGVLAIVDPGDEAERIVDRVRGSGLKPAMILHTHGHLDHAGATRDVLEALGKHLPVGLHPEELPLYRALPDQGRAFGFGSVQPPDPTLWLEHGATLELGSLGLEVRHTPGHSPGGVVLVVRDAAEPLVLAGDVLFAGSIGRTDLPGGSFEVLERSIREQLYTLPDEMRVIPGHGPATTIGAEKASNPFVRA